MDERSILQLCKDSQRIPGSRNRPYWWDQDLSAPEEEVWSIYHIIQIKLWYQKLDYPMLLHHLRFLLGFSS